MRTILGCFAEDHEVVIISVSGADDLVVTPSLIGQFDKSECD